MMTEIWPKIFAVALVVAFALKLGGSQTNFVTLFAKAAFGVLAVFLVAMVVFNVYSDWKKQKEE